ncbi:protein of unknown function (plasmid) [Pararobbsia alpina]
MAALGLPHSHDSELIPPLFRADFGARFLDRSCCTLFALPTQS